MRFYTIKLPRFIGGIIQGIMGMFRKNK
ncbi:MAG: stage V sporulation protein SpoVM [Bacillaceae bacterium]|nr:stage V sporulation protein SpoVM [Bacillaceae bacterium]